MVSWSSLRPVGAADPGVHHPVARDDLHPVACVPGQRGEQERGIHRGVEPGGVADATGARARGVEHDDDPPVLLGLPGAHDEVLAPGGRPPVDGAHVVTLDVLAQAVELGALPSGAHGRAPVELAEHRQPARQVPPRRERVQRPERPRHRERPLARGEPQRPEDPHGDAVGSSVTTTGRGEVGGEAHPLVRRHGEVVHGILRSGGGRPGVPQQAAHPTTGGVGDPQAARRALAEAHLGGPAAHDAAGRSGGSRAARRARRAAGRRAATTAPSPHSATRRPVPAPAGPARRCAR